MKFLALLAIILSIFAITSESWLWRRRSQRKNAYPSITPATFTASTPCSSNRKCSQFDDVYNQSVLIFSACTRFLNGSCVFANAQEISSFSEAQGDRLRNVLNGISEICDCRNRSTEIFCRFFLPECSVSEKNQMCPDKRFCGFQEPLIKDSCFGYCNKLLNR